VTVNAVAPGLIDSPAIAAAVPPEAVKRMVPARRLGRPGEVAELVAFLCSDRAGYITGQTVSINGGMA
jgi:3-oxoacyl-[acyl-carrier protein] reductase